MDLDCDNIIIIPKPEQISWEDVTKLLNLAYSEWNEQGLNYVAATQNVSVTIKRSIDKVCLVALDDNKLLGTITYSIIKNNRSKWYYNSSYIFFSQFAVDPKIKKKGIGNKLQTKVEQIGEEAKVGSIICHTAVKAEKLLSWYYKKGFRKVDFTSFSKTNYYSVVLWKPIKDEKHNPLYRISRFYISKIKCLILKNENGQYRLFFKIVKQIIRS